MTATPVVQARMAWRSCSGSIVIFSPVVFHHNGEGWVSQDKNGMRRIKVPLTPLYINILIRYYYTKAIWIQRHLILRAAAAFVHCELCKLRLASPFYWQRSLLPCRHGD